MRKIITPGEIISKIFSVVKVTKDSSSNLLTGKPILEKYLKNKKQKLEKDQTICVFAEDKFIGMYNVVKEKYFFAKPKFVMQPIRGKK